MIAYVDSNVVLEIVMGQSQSQAAHKLLESAVDGRFQIKLPVFVLYEIEQRLRRLSAVRQDLAVLFGNHAETLGVANREIAAEGQRAAQAMADRFLSEDDDLQVTKLTVLAPVLSVAEVLPLTYAILLRAQRLTNEEGSLHLADAVVAATVLEDIAVHKTPSVWVTKDSGIHKDPDVVQTLARSGCKVIGSIRGGLDYLLKNP